MSLSSNYCPNCNKAYNSSTNRCSSCGCYIFESSENFKDYSNYNFPKDANGDYSRFFIMNRFLDHNEIPVGFGKANLYTGSVSAGGQLLLTNKRIYFKAHAFNVGRKEAVIELNDIISAARTNNFLVSQHILVTTNRERFRFVVFNGDSWVRIIMNAVNNAKLSTQYKPVFNMPDDGKKCPACGRVNERSSKFCITCGHNLTETVNPEPQPETITENKKASSESVIIIDEEKLTLELQKYKNLFEQNLIDEEEYNNKKKQLLGL